jgi:hypothetical protein
MEEKDRHLRKYYIPFSIIVIVIFAFIVIYDQRTFWDNKGDLVHLIALALSVIAFGITIAEIYAISDIAMLTNKIVRETKEKIKTREDIAEISGVIQSINGALEDINNLKFISATHKLREVKKAFVNIYEAEELEKEDSIERIHYDYIDQIINAIGHLKDNATFSNVKKEAIHVQLNHVTNKLLIYNKKIKLKGI